LPWWRRPAPRPLHPAGFPCTGETGPDSAVEGSCTRSFLLDGRGDQHSRLHPFRLHHVRLDAEGWRAETPVGSVPGGPDGRGDQPPDRTAAVIPPDPGLLAHGSHEQHPWDVYRGIAFPSGYLPTHSRNLRNFPTTAFFPDKKTHTSYIFWLNGRRILMANLYNWIIISY